MRFHDAKLTRHVRARQQRTLTCYVVAGRRRHRHNCAMGKKLNFGRVYISEWRRASGVTQEELAERAEVTGATISRIENGKQNWTIGTLSRIASVLGCRPIDLLAGPPLSSDLRALVAQAPLETQRQAEAVLRALLRESAA